MLPSRILFDDFMDEPLFHNDNFDKLMKMDIYEKDNKYTIEIDVPGYKKEDIKMDLENGYLTVKAERHSKDEDKKDRKYIHRERRFDEKCERQIYVGDVDSNQIKAEFKNGTLFITVPKQEENKENKKYISIN